MPSTATCVPNSISGAAKKEYVLFRFYPAGYFPIYMKIIIIA
jgi:hypothetical protein